MVSPMKKLFLSLSIVSLLALSAVAGEKGKCDKAGQAECPLKAKKCDKAAKAECQGKKAECKGKKTACAEKQAKLNGKGAEALR